MKRAARLLIVAALAGCAEGGTDPVTVPVPTALRLSVDRLVLDDGGTARIHAIVVDAWGEALADAGAPIGWSSSDAEVASVDGGRVSANRPGEVRITASAGQLRAHADVTVRAVATELRPASGDDQVAVVGSQLPDSIVVRVVDRHGAGVAGVFVSFQAAGGGGAVVPGMAVTGDDGVAAAVWVLGTGVGENVAEARVAGLAGSPALFRATGTPGAPAVLSRVAGDGQIGAVASALEQALVACVTDLYGNPLAGVAVDWAVAAGDGSVAPLSMRTDAAGLARAAWTLGPEEGVHAATVEAAGLLVPFTATAVAGATN